jgi:hypothetical protein
MEQSKKAAVVAAAPVVAAALTIHLYLYEEVLASLRWAIMIRNYTEAIFWALELYDSDMLDVTPLIEFWIQQTGFTLGSLSTLASLLSLKDLTRGQFIYSIYAWCRLETDPTCFHLLIRGSLRPHTWTINFPHLMEFKDLSQAAYNCLTRRKLTESWLIARGLSAEDQWSLIDRFRSTDDLINLINLIKGLDISDCLKRVACFTIVSLPRVELDKCFIIPPLRDVPDELIERIDEWDNEESIKLRRQYKVRPEAIAYTCSRSSLPTAESNISYIEENFEAELEASPCWQSILEDYQTGGQWKSDRYKELFYEAYFPYASDDIPDEWSNADKEKSHGRGLGKPNEAALRQYINHVIRHKSVWLYDSCEPLTDKLPSSLDWDTVYSDLLGPCSSHLQSMLPFKPIIKQFMIS